jgi:hypothetical protein
MEHAGPIALRGQEGPGPLAAGCLDPAGHPYDTPDLLCPSRMTQQPREPLGHLPAIGCGPAVAALHLEARRVAPSVLDALAAEKPVEPKPSATGFVATHHPGLRG